MTFKIVHVLIWRHSFVLYLKDSNDQISKPKFSKLQGQSVYNKLET